MGSLVPKVLYMPLSELPFTPVLVYVIDPVKAVSIIGLVLELSFLDCPIFQAPHPAMFLSLVIPRFLLWTLPKPCPWSPQAQSSLFLVVSGRFSPSASFHSNVSVRTASDVPVSASWGHPSSQISLSEAVTELPPHCHVSMWLPIGSGHGPIQNPKPSLSCHCHLYSQHSKRPYLQMPWSCFDLHSK